MLKRNRIPGLSRSDMSVNSGLSQVADANLKTVEDILEIIASQSWARCRHPVALMMKQSRLAGSTCHAYDRQERKRLKSYRTPLSKASLGSVRWGGGGWKKEDSEVGVCLLLCKDPGKPRLQIVVAALHTRSPTPSTVYDREGHCVLSRDGTQNK